METSIGYRDSYFNFGEASTRSYAVIWISLFAVIGWLLAFIGLCTSASLAYPLSWWIVVFEFCLIVFVCAVIWADMAHSYYPVILALIAISIPYSTNEVALYLLAGRASFSAAAAGHIVLMVAELIWLFLFGTLRDGNTTLLQSFHDGNQRSVRSSSSNMMLYRNNMTDVNNKAIVTASAGAGHFSGTSTSQQGYDYVEPVSPTPPPPPPPSMERDRAQTYIHHSADNHDTVYVKLHAEYTIPVVAMHSYDANPEDPDELSFAKGELLYVHEKKGSWWQAKKSNGAIGLIPNNYVTSTIPK